MLPMQNAAPPPRGESVLGRVAECNVVYHVLGETDRSAMPIGNGELAASVWVDGEGVICFYLSRTDALSELDRTIKLGGFEIVVNPVQFTPDCFSQELLLADGAIRLTGKNGEVMIWVDKGSDCVRVTGRFDVPAEVSVRYVCWRTNASYPSGEFATQGEVCESADIVRETGDEILFYHLNGKNIIPEVAETQGLAGRLDLLPDFLTGRVFGGLSRLVRREKGFELCIATASSQTEENLFVRELRGTLDGSVTAEKSLQETTSWWNNYWRKSYIFVENDEPVETEYDPELLTFATEPREYSCGCTSSVTRAYIFTKYMNACCNEGNFPVLYNGLLFNLCPGGGEHFSTENFGRTYTRQPLKDFSDSNPDERSWCREHLWQNMRHPYFSLLERGEGEKLLVLFRYYKNFWPLNRARAALYYGAKGQHNTEMTLSFGLQSNDIYGTDRANLPKGYAGNRWGGAVDISPGLELVSLMLDYWDFMRDEEFLRSEALPYCHELLQYIETRFPAVENEKMVIGPLNSVETYRETINPIPVVAGLHSVLRRVLSLEESLVEEYAYFSEYVKKLPPLPAGLHEGRGILLPARIFKEERHNVEIPELYACFPFRNFTFYKDDKELARNTYAVRTAQYDIRRCFIVGETPNSPSYSGWQYLGAVSAVLGLAEEARTILTHNCTLQNPGTRFPGMWGPIYDAVPDTDHGANILTQLQQMVMQTDGKTIYLLPAFPQEWNVDFKLYADKDTTVEVQYRGGRLQKVEVSPPERAKDICVCQ